MPIAMLSACVLDDELKRRIRVKFGPSDFERVVRTSERRRKESDSARLAQCESGDLSVKRSRRRPHGRVPACVSSDAIG